MDYSALSLTKSKSEANRDFLGCLPCSCRVCGMVQGVFILLVLRFLVNNRLYFKHAFAGDLHPLALFYFTYFGFGFFGFHTDIITERG